MSERGISGEQLRELAFDEAHDLAFYDCESFENRFLEVNNQNLLDLQKAEKP